MLTAFLFFLVYVWLTIIHVLLSAIPIGVPVQVTAAVTYFGGYIHYLDGYVDTPGVFAAVSFFIQFLLAFFAYKVVMWIYHLAAARGAHASQAMPAERKTK